jgi:hypothetical protein
MEWDCRCRPESIRDRMDGSMDPPSRCDDICDDMSTDGGGSLRVEEMVLRKGFAKPVHDEIRFPL